MRRGKEEAQVGQQEVNHFRVEAQQVEDQEEHPEQSILDLEVHKELLELLEQLSVDQERG